jgi:transcriptional regulator with XRE-family HTH domain
MRHVKGISQEELAAQAGLYRTYVGHLGREVHSSTVDMPEKLAEILEIAPTDFFIDPPPPIPEALARKRHGPDPVVVVVGHRLRTRRQSLRLSQRKPGETLGVTFQQIQQYERGMNRMAVTTARSKRNRSDQRCMEATSAWRRRSLESRTGGSRCGQDAGASSVNREAIPVVKSTRGDAQLRP